MKIQYGEDSFDVHAIIAIKDKERCLDGRGIASTAFCPDMASVKRVLESGYEPLCFVFHDGSTKYVVKPEQLAQAEKIARAVEDMARIPGTKAKHG